ncbi:MAG: hypothetical protein H0X65_21125 [Gemmatimonadetes bacterium]|nr:hypothetical protein [Gemmatimonadota bacterium]
MVSIPPKSGRRGNEEGGRPVVTCDYNGWNDAPEEEREWFDAHPEIWAGSVRSADIRPIRATPPAPARRSRGGMAA